MLPCDTTLGDDIPQSFGKCWPNRTTALPTVARFWPSSAKICRFGPTLCKLRPTAASFPQLGQSVDDTEARSPEQLFSSFGAIFGQVGDNLGLRRVGGVCLGEALRYWGHILCHPESPALVAVHWRGPWWWKMGKDLRVGHESHPGANWQRTAEYAVEGDTILFLIGRRGPEKRKRLCCLLQCHLQA